MAGGRRGCYRASGTAPRRVLLKELLGAPLGGGKERDRDRDGEKQRLRECKKGKTIRTKPEKESRRQVGLERGVGNGPKRECYKDEKINATENEVYRETQNCTGRDKRYI